MSLGTPAREPLSISVFFIPSCSVRPAQPILLEIDTTAAQRDR